MFNPMQMLNGMMGSGQNPMMQMVSMLQKGGNPQAMLSQMAQGNPQLQQIMNMTQGKSSSQLQQMAQNLAKERGVDLDSMAKQMGIKLPH